MNLFAQLQNQASQVKTKDVDFSGKFTVDSGAYDAVIRVAYLDKSEKGAAFVSLEAILNINGKERTYKENIYISKADGSLTYTDKNGEQQPMVGFATVDTICKLATGKPFSEQTTELKGVKIRKNQQDVVEPREVLMDLCGAKVILGIVETKEDHYNKPGETQLKNNIRKVFSEDGRTLNEHEANVNAKATGGDPVEAKYINGWKEANEGKLVDKTGKKPAQGKPAAGNPAQQAAPSLF